MIRIDVVREKAGCSPECVVTITDDGKVRHNAVTWRYNVADHMDPAYEGEGWLSKAMATIAGQHAKAAKR